uniref:Uncharacterized protein n=1 Tax=Tetradesmus obliquus TaxID=3088 RepID=A0A383VWV9_TETOB|eukprot:jgi/Sobl393_1/13414/SZX69958.1
MRPAALSISLCCNLRTLEIQGGKVQLQPATSSTGSNSSSSSASSSNPFTALTALTSLRLPNCAAMQFGFGLSQLTALSALQQLVLLDIMVGDGSEQQAADGDTGAFSAELGSTLGQLVQLTNLVLSLQRSQGHGVRLDGAVCTAASRLSRLQSLCLDAVGTQELPLRLQQLPQSLTMLSLRSGVTSSQELGGRSITSSSSSIDGSFHVPALQELSIRSTVFDPAALLHMPQLQDLDVAAGCTNIPMHDMLAVLPGLPKPQKLSLHELSGVAAAEQYAGLTACSHLEELKVIDCRVAGTAAQHMFRASRPLPALHHICVASSTEASRMYGRPPSVSGQIRLLLGPRDVQRFVDSCTLGEQAPALMAGDGGRAHAGRGRLRSLRISAAPRFTCKGLLHLTRLEQLSEIIVDGCNTVYAYGADGAMAAACARLGIQHDEIGNVRNAQQQDFSMSYRDYYRGHGSEVWQRLRKLCDKSPQCQ